MTRRKIDNITISGESVHWLNDSVEVYDLILERSTATFTVVDEDGTHYQQGEPVVITDDNSTNIFSGIISSPVERRMSPQGGLIHEIECVDWNYLADKRIIADSYENKTAGYIVNDILNNYLADEDVASGEIQDGPTITKAVFNYISVSQALDQLAETAGFWWKIDVDKKIYFVARNTNTAPMNIETSIIIRDSFSVEHSNSMYRNRQYVMGKDVTDTQTEYFVGDGERAAFSVGFPIASVPTVSVDPGTGYEEKTVGIKGVDTGKDWYWSKGDQVILQDSGAAQLEATDTLKVEYSGQYKFVFRSEIEENVTERQTVEGGGSGYVEDFFYDANIESREAAFEIGNAKFERFGSIDRNISFVTEEPGFESGQVAEATHSLHNLSGELLLIQSVRIYTENGYILYEVSALEGSPVGSWAQYFARISSPENLLIDSIEINSEEIVIILEQVSETMEISEIVTESVYSCPVPSPTLYPAADLYPC